jgi:hypothetical protein
MVAVKADDEESRFGFDEGRFQKMGRIVDDGPWRHEHSWRISELWRCGRKVGGIGRREGWEES